MFSCSANANETKLAPIEIAKEVNCWWVSDFRILHTYKKKYLDA